MAIQHNFLCLHSEQRRRVDFRFAALSKASGHNYRSRIRTWYRNVGSSTRRHWCQPFFCGIGGISDTSIGIGRTLLESSDLITWASSQHLSLNVTWQYALEKEDWPWVNVPVLLVIFMAVTDCTIENGSSIIWVQLCWKIAINACSGVFL